MSCPCLLRAGRGASGSVLLPAQSEASRIGQELPMGLQLCIYLTVGHGRAPDGSCRGDRGPGSVAHSLLRCALRSDAVKGVEANNHLAQWGDRSFGDDLI